MSDHQLSTQANNVTPVRCRDTNHSATAARPFSRAASQHIFSLFLMVIFLYHEHSLEPKPSEYFFSLHKIFL
jgi:hypothetical protein